MYSDKASERGARLQNQERDGRTAERFLYSIQSLRSCFCNTLRKQNGFCVKRHSLILECLTKLHTQLV
jgi:hypothetical protein